MANTFIAGGRGTMADAANDNGGGFLISGTATYSTCQGANGGPTSDTVTWGGGQAECTITEEPVFSLVRITHVSGTAFVNCVAGSISYVEFSDATYADDWYAVEFVEGSGTYVDINLAYVANKTCDIHVGGAFKDDGTGIAQGLSLFAAANGDHLQIASNVASPTTYAVAGEITTPSVAGTAAAPFRIYGVDHSDGTELTNEDYRPILQATAVINSIFSWVAAFDYCNVEMINFDGNTDKASYCWHWGTDHNSDYHTIKHCRFHHAISHGIHANFNISYTFFSYNEFDNNGGVGFYIRGSANSLIGNRIHHNSSIGCRAFIFSYGALLFNYIYSNGSDGVYVGHGLGSSVACNCIYNNSGSGLDLNSAGTAFPSGVVNNTIFGSGGYGINNSNIGVLHWPMDLMQLSNNHSWDNTLGHCPEMVDEFDNDEWATFMDGDNITGDPKCVDVANADFRLRCNSPLIRAGIDGTNIGASGVKKYNPGLRGRYSLCGGRY